MDLRRLEIFLAVVRERSFTRAAAKLHVSQSAVSQQVAALESELGTTLIDRRRRRIDVTPSGAVMVDWADRLLADSAAARRAVVAADGRVSGQLRIAASLTIASYVLPEALAALALVHPAVRVEVGVQNTSHVSVALYDGHVDLGLIEGDADLAGLDTEWLRDDELVVIAPAWHRFADGLEVAFADLAGEPFIARERGSGSRQVAETALRAAGHPPESLRVVAELAGIEPIKAAVEAGLGVAIVSALSIRRELREETLVARTIRGVEMRRAMTAVFAPGHAVLPAARELVRLVRESRRAPRAMRVPGGR
jgi:LysR family transcriptional regulator, transcriptional activator of the cysJI operon